MGAFIVINSIALDFFFQIRFACGVVPPDIKHGEQFITMVGEQKELC